MGLFGVFIFLAMVFLLARGNGTDELSIGLGLFTAAFCSMALVHIFIGSYQIQKHFEKWENELTEEQKTTLKPMTAGTEFIPNPSDIVVAPTVITPDERRRLV